MSMPRNGMARADGSVLGRSKAGTRYRLLSFSFSLYLFNPPASFQKNGHHARANAMTQRGRTICLPSVRSLLLSSVEAIATGKPWPVPLAMPPSDSSPPPLPF